MIHSKPRSLTAACLSAEQPSSGSIRTRRWNERKKMSNQNAQPQTNKALDITVVTLAVIIAAAAVFAFTFLTEESLGIRLGGGSRGCRLLAFGQALHCVLPRILGRAAPRGVADPQGDGQHDGHRDGFRRSGVDLPLPR